MSIVKKLTGSILFIGVGLCGCRQVRELEKRGYQCYYLNTTEVDFDLVGDVADGNKYTFPNAKGCAKNRGKAFQYALDNLDMLSKKILTDHSSFVHYVFVFSTGGGSGSGIAPALAQYFGNMFEEEGKDKTVSVMGTFPDKNDGRQALLNHRDCLEYLEEECPNITSKIYLDNSEMDKFEINSQICDLIDALMGIPEVANKDDIKALERKGVKQADEEEALTLWRTVGCVNMAILNSEKVIKSDSKKEEIENVVFMPKYSKGCVEMAVSIRKEDNLDFKKVIDGLIGTYGRGDTDIKGGFRISEDEYEKEASYAFMFGIPTPKYILDKADSLLDELEDEISESRQNVDVLSFTKRTSKLSAMPTTSTKEPASKNPFKTSKNPFNKTSSFK